MSTPMDKIRNFSIIAHIDHGKSTLADRLLETTGSVESRVLRTQHLDMLDIERERGITIKLQPVRMKWNGFIYNLIDTPGHVDFTYEVSRSLAAVEGAILLVDASQGIQAQTLANLYLAMEQNVSVIPVVNKVDLPNAEVEKTSRELQELIGCSKEDIIYASGKSGVGVLDILKAVENKVPQPKGGSQSELRALVFDSIFDEYKGVIVFVRLVDGHVKKGDVIKFVATGAETSVEEVGIFRPKYEETDELGAGEIGYIATGLKDVKKCRVGDTVILTSSPTSIALPGYREVKPVVYVGLFPREGDSYAPLRDALDRLSLNDSALQYEAEYSPALGYGFRAGFLGLLHLEVTSERLQREYGLALTVTVPSVAYRITKKDGKVSIVKNPWSLPDPSHILEIAEPWVGLDIVTPKDFVGGIMQLVSSKKGEYINTEYLEGRAILHYRLPLQSILVDFYDKLKGVSSGYASMNYDLAGYRAADVVRLDFLVAEEPVEALSIIVYREDAHRRGKQITMSLKDSLPRQQFVVKIQAAIGGKIVASEKLSAMKKNVTAKLYGGDVTRKQKLLEKQKKGKKKLASLGRGKVEIPSEVFLNILKK